MTSYVIKFTVSRSGSRHSANACLQLNSAPNERTTERTGGGGAAVVITLIQFNGILLFLLLYMLYIRYVYYVL